MDRKPKTVFQLDSPFTKVPWPPISHQNQETILELLCSILSPIRQYRSNHATPSNGKRSKKRKRQDAKLGRDVPIIATPPPPEILPFLVVGFNSIARSLEFSSRRTNPKILYSLNASEKQDSRETLHSSSFLEKAKVSKPSPNPLANNANRPPFEGHFSAIFVTRSPQPAILQAHLPQLVATASLAYPELPATRLVQLPDRSEARLCEALNLPRVSLIGIVEEAPQSMLLVQFIRESVPEVDIPWLREAGGVKYLPLKINAIETFTPVVNKERA